MPIVSRVASLAAVAALCVCTLGVAAPASALPGDATLSFWRTAVFSDGSCIDHAFTYAVELPEGTSSWTLDVELVGPDGQQHGSEVIGTVAQDPPTGSGAFRLCPGVEPMGTYTVLSTVDYTVGTSPAVAGTQQVEGTFEAVPRARTRTRLTARRTGATITATARVTVSAGGDPSAIEAGARVLLQKKVGPRKWRTVAQGRTDARGAVRRSFASRGRTSVRAFFPGSGAILVAGQPVPPSVSNVVAIR